MENSMKISHEFVEDKECKDDQKCNVKNNEAVICVGATGAGKSSLIRLFCGDNVIVCHSVNSGTQASTLFKEIRSDRYWLDSQGANDSNGVDDEKVLTDVLKALYDNTISSIKVIWCIAGDFDRCRKDLQTQAQFIKSLGECVWNSCLIVQKKGPIEPDDIDGALAAVTKTGANIDYGDGRLFGYTGIDFMSDDDKKKDRLLRKILKKPDSTKRRKELEEDGYLDNQQIVKHINGRLSSLSSLNITFKVMKCKKCGEKGDPRFVYAPCHAESEKYHPKELILYHGDGKLKKVHFGTNQKYHPTPNINNVHTGALTYYHWGSWTTTYSTEYYHSSSRLYWNLLKHGDTRWRHNCCENYKGHRGCKSRQVSSSSYSCCGSTNSSGCTSKWTCCDGPGSSKGCREEWECCRFERNIKGCEERYSCCEGSLHSIGCREEWDCCNTQSDNKGCKRKYQCCDKQEGEEGCKDRCKACNAEWGEGPGCIETTKNKK